MRVSTVGAGRCAISQLASESAVVEQLLRPLDELARRHRPQAVAASGGVAANTLLRDRSDRLGCPTGG